MCTPFPASCDTHSHTPALFSPLSQSCLQRNQCNYWVLRLWLLQAIPWGINITTYISLLFSSLLFSSLLFSSLLWLCGHPLFSSIDLVWATVRTEASCEAVSTKWPVILTSYISHAIKGGSPTTRCVNGADTCTHLHTHTWTLSEWSKQH